ncbi:acyl-CoA dehydrogenase family protein [Rhodococcus qingshengii]|uniref:acyl-CoA dehydrogenase family protein n=1 Tax=Rhodococcus qingshengii TaxID=334542 RepID=UPI001E61FCD2|nr:acyl-CoA dehydrogenase family protein [Rhodococcus qingshengii]MCQ4150589.1 acyl-CoA/acyl-ACP dehydrogenase [Rhodococcus qingshengii]UGQ55423.1 acyl-CoA/acyl-ACP dehydrogenase [Rhodococcus qingshengii]
MLRDTVRDYFGEAFPLTRLMDFANSDRTYDRALWDQLSNKMELVGLAVPENLGGSGYSLYETCVVLSEMGRVLCPSPFFASTVLACEALLATDDETFQAEVIPQLVKGDLTGTLAGMNPKGWFGEDLVVRAESGGDGWKLSGVDSTVLDAATADVVLVLARTADGPELFAVQRESTGVHLESLDGIDFTRPIGRLTLDGAPARRIGSPGVGNVVLERIRLVVPVCQAAEQVGAAERCLEIAVEHAKGRKQFGKPIGSFQAVKHHCASVLLAVEAAKWTALYGAWSVANDLPDRVPVAAMTQASCSDALQRASENLIQVLGGIGYTWEHPAHAYFRRAVASREIFGSVAAQRESVAAAYLDR